MTEPTGRAQLPGKGLSRLYSILLSGMLAFALAACGGGGGTSDPGFIGGGADPGDPAEETTFQVSLALTDGAGASTSTITSSSPGTLTVTIVDGTGAPVVDEIATVEAELVAVTPSSLSQLTDTNGVAVFTLSASADSGAGTAKVTFGDDTASVNYEVDVQLAIALTDTIGNPITTISDAVPGIVTATSSDSQGVAIEGDLISVSTSAGTVSPANALTDSNGEALFVLEAGTGFGAGTVTVSSGNRAASLNFDIVSTAADTNLLSLSLTDTAGNPVTNVTSIAPAILTVTATNSQGNPLASEVVSAATVSGLGVVSPESGTALTDINGVATFTVSAGPVLGADTVVVTLGVVDESVNFQVGEANLRIGRFAGSTFIEGEIEAGSTSLSAAGSTPLSVTIVDVNDVPVTTVVPVLFGSGCANLVPPQAQVSGEVNTVNGVATSTYTADGCVGLDTVSAGIVQGNSQGATVVLTIASASINSISFVGADPQTIALKGTGGQGRSETSTVSFQVLDTTGAPVSGVDVSFTLSTTVGGLSLTNPVATTNELGIARAIVQAGNVSTSVRVTATITVGGVDFSTVSDSLVVSTGLPDQNSISLSSSLLNPGGGDVDGVTATLTVRMADKFNNPVPDGTVAFFSTELGSIGDSCETVGGTCFVTWSSQDPRLPLIYNTTAPGTGTSTPYVSTIFNRTCPETGLTGYPCPSSLGQIFGRRTTVTVIAIGEESFIDSNGNGVFDAGEPFDDLPEAWVDNNENDIFDNTASPACTQTNTTVAGRECAEGLEEIFFDFNENGTYTNRNNLYNGSLCPQGASGCTQDLVHVRDDIQLVMSNANLVFVVQEVFPDPILDVPVTSEIIMPAGGPDRLFNVVVGDVFNNPPTAGTSVSIAAESCEIIGGDFAQPDTNSIGPTVVSFLVRNQSDNAADLEGSITVTVDDQVLIIPCTDITL